jgi:hypothetical protein
MIGNDSATGKGTTSVVPTQTAPKKKRSFSPVEADPSAKQQQTIPNASTTGIADRLI